MSEPARSPTLRESAQEYGRGLAGGLIFSLPLLYTMEVWWTAFVASPLRLLIYVGVTFGLLLLYNRYSGLHQGSQWREIAVDSVEEMGLGLLLSLGLMVALRRISFDMPLSETLGKVVTEGMLAAIGVSVGTAQLGEGSPQAESKPEFLGQLGLAVCGAVLIGGNVAPTEEIVQIATGATAWHLIVLVVVSLLAATLVLAGSGFRGNRPFSDCPGIPAIPFGTVCTFLVATVVSGFELWFFGRLKGTGFSIGLAEIVVLNVPTTLGASAGRLLLQQ